MDGARFDAWARRLSRRSHRRTALLGGLAAALAGVGGRLAAQDAASPAASPGASPAASPAASPVASPGPLDLLGGTPQADGGVLTRSSDAECRVATDPCTQPGCERYCPGS